MTDYKQLCAELLEWAERTSSHYYKQADVIIRARAALAEPEPEWPTDEELKQWYSDCADETIIGNAEHYWAFEVPVDFDLVRAVLARWGK